jgi:hypothetical protein
MKALCLSGAGIAALLALVPAGASAQVLPGGTLAPVIQQPGHGSLFPSPMPQQHGRFGSGHHGHGFGRGGFILYDDEPEVVHDVVVVHDEAPGPPPPPPPPRQRWVLGRSYDSLPSGCLKMLTAGGAFFGCSGEWYRQTGNAQYKAVGSPL